MIVQYVFYIPNLLYKMTDITLSTSFGSEVKDEFEQKINYPDGKPQEKEITKWTQDR